MSSHSHLLIFGASTRAAAFSALRAGLQPWCADLFADADLEARCPVMRLPAGTYPHGFLGLAASDLPGPWMYTGGMENRPALVRDIAARRPLWGNGFVAISLFRNPWVWEGMLRSKGIPCPQNWFLKEGKPPGDRRWLVKPLTGAGGAGIHPWNGEELTSARAKRLFLQEIIDGEACAAIYLAKSTGSRLVGVTRQLVGESWLHAAPYHYCGSLGPLALDKPQRRAFQLLGAALVKGADDLRAIFGNEAPFRGLFGVDCVLKGGVPYPVEINPRYTASVEVLEHATGTPALALHRQVFESDCPAPVSGQVADRVIGKAILFARQPLTFPADGPWMQTLRQPGDVWDLPAFADIPHAGQSIEAGRPILTFFARADSLSVCREELQRIAADLDRWLYS
jgi:uncharacterized protein